MTFKEFVCGGENIPTRTGFHLKLWPLHIRIRNWIIFAVNRAFGYE